MANINLEELKEIRKQWFAKMEQELRGMQPNEEDSLFYYHSSEDRIVLSHVFFWTMTLPQFFKGKIRKEKFFHLLRQYEEEMLDAFLQEDDYFSDLLHSQDLRNERAELEFCNIMYEMLPTILSASHLKGGKDTRKLAAISVVAGGYGGDIPEELCNELLDDIDYFNDRVKCRKIEQMMPKLMKMVENEMKGMG